MLNQDEIDAGFHEVQQRRFMLQHLDEIRDPDFWRRLNPELTISENPFPAVSTRASVDPSVAERATRQILKEGYLQTPPLVDAGVLERLRTGIERINGLGTRAGSQASTVTGEPL